jgi:mandelamide amidase
MRIPAAFCGTVGFRPSTFPRKLYSQEGVVPVVLDLDTIGPMGRSVADVAMLHAAIVGQHPVGPVSLETVRIGVPRLPYWDDLDPEVERVAQAALARLRGRGAVLVEIDLRGIKDAAWEMFYTLISIGFADLEDFLGAQVPPLSLSDLIEQIASRDVRAGVDRVGVKRPDQHLLHARAVGRDAIRAAYRAIFWKHGIQAVVFPTEVLTPPSIRAAGDDPDEMIEFNGRAVSKGLTILRNTVPAVALGAPALSLPAGLTSNGLPVGLEFDGLPGDDSALLALGRAAEAAIGRVPAPLEVVRRSTAVL